jgi:glycosyltransferase involved in cell wall biosynthesis
MRILIATVQVPFTSGGAELHAQELQKALRSQGHAVEIVSVPFKWYPPEKILDHILANRLLDLSECNGTPVDRLIGLKFPAYLIPHPNKVIWILHQYRTAYDLWDTPYNDLIHYPNGVQVREAIRRADCQLIPEAKAVFANSRNVANRLKHFCGLDSIPLYHPPQNANLFYISEAEDYIFCPSRLCPLKRQTLVLEALALTRSPVRVCFAGVPDAPEYAAELKELADQRDVQQRVKWLGFISEEEKRKYYAQAKAIAFPPVDEDYGYITLEAMLSSKPVITCTDSGGPLEFIYHGETGLISEPTPPALADAFDRIWHDPKKAKSWGKAGRELYDSLDITWSNVTKRLLA